MALVKKVLTHDFDTEDSNIIDFDSYMNDFLNYIDGFLSADRQIFTYSNKPTLTKNSVTTITVNTKNTGVSGGGINPILLGLLGFSIGNQTIQVLSIELLPNQLDSGDSKHHDEIRVQLYNPSDVDIVTDFKIQYYFSLSNFYTE